MPRTTTHPRQPKQLKDSIKKLTAFHALGQKALKQWHQAAGINAYGVVSQHARKLQCSTSQVFSARLFAETIDDTELQRFVALMKQHGRRVSVCHVRALATVPDKKSRWEYARRLAEENWSVRQLKAEIRKEYPKRGRGGRPVQLAADVTSLLHQMRKMCAGWQRYEKGFALERNALAAAARAELPQPVEQAYKQVLRAVGKLAEALEE